MAVILFAYIQFTTRGFCIPLACTKISLLPCYKVDWLLAHQSKVWGISVSVQLKNKIKANLWRRNATLNSFGAFECCRQWFVKMSVNLQTAIFQPVVKRRSIQPVSSTILIIQSVSKIENKSKPIEKRLMKMKSKKIIRWQLLSEVI